MLPASAGPHTTIAARSPSRPPPLLWSRWGTLPRPRRSPRFLILLGHPSQVQGIRIRWAPDRDWGRLLPGARRSSRFLILFWYSSQVQDVVAPDEHFAQVASELAVDPLLRARQLSGQWRAVRKGSGALGQTPHGHVLHDLGACVLRLARRPHLQIHVRVHRYQIACTERRGERSQAEHSVQRSRRAAKAGHAASGRAPLYSMPHLSLATTGLPVRSLRNGFGLTGTCQRMGEGCVRPSLRQALPADQPRTVAIVPRTCPELPPPVSSVLTAVFCFSASWPPQALAAQPCSRRWS